MAALMAPMRSSSKPCGISEAIIRPSMEMMAEASISVELPLSSLRTDLSISASMVLTPRGWGLIRLLHGETPVQMDDEFDQLWSVESGLAGNGQYEAFAADMERPESQLAVAGCIG